MNKTDSKLYARTNFYCSDVQRSITFYVEKLGFEKKWDYKNGEKILSAQVDRNSCELMLTHFSNVISGGGGLYISLHKREQLQSFYEEFKDKGVLFETEIHRTYWNSTEFSVLDPDGNRIVFSG